MIYKIVRLTFTGDVHFGSGILESSASTLTADTIFSALCCELAGSGRSEQIEQLVLDVKNRVLMLSDTFPFKGEQLYLPKPFIPVRAENDDGDSVKKKSFRKLKYIPMEKYDAFLQGKFTYEECQDTLNEISETNGFSLYMQVAVRRESDPEPYSVGKIRFSNNCGLWLIIAASDESKMEEITGLFRSLGHSGIGGKRSAGCGRFSVDLSDVPLFLCKALKRRESPYISLSTSLPKENEMEKALEGAYYSLMKRSGFVYSEDYSSTPQKKNDLYVFEAGSSFRNLFSGDVYDVSSNGFHPVYRYAVPMFISIGGNE